MNRFDDSRDDEKSVQLSKDECFRNARLPYPFYEKLSRDELIKELSGIPKEVDLNNLDENTLSPKQRELLNQTRELTIDALNEFYEIRTFSKLGHISGQLKGLEISNREISVKEELTDKENTAGPSLEEPKDEFSKQPNEFIEFINNRDLEDIKSFEMLTKRIYNFMVFRNRNISKYIDKDSAKLIMERTVESCTSQLNDMKLEFKKAMDEILKQLEQQYGKDFRYKAYITPEYLDQIQNYPKVLKEFGLNDKRINDFKVMYMDDSLDRGLKVFIILSEIRYIIYNSFKSRLIINLPDSIRKKSYTDKKNHKIGFDKKLENIKFNIPQIKMLLDNSEVLGEDILFKLFNKTTDGQIKKDINTLIKLKDKYSANIKGSGRDAVNKKADQFCYNYIMNANERQIVDESKYMLGEYIYVVPEAFDRFQDILNWMK